MIDIRVSGAGGEYMESVVIVEWHKAIGDAIAAGDVVVSVETAKATIEIEAEQAGILAEISAQTGQEVDVGTILGRIREPSDPQTSNGQPFPEPVVQRSEPVAAVPSATLDKASGPQSDRVVASPLARRVAAHHGIDLTTVSPSGASRRIKRRDIDVAVEARSRSRLPVMPVTGPLASVVSADGETKHIAMSGAAPLVLIHGFGSDAHSWRSLISALKIDRPIIAIELPSHGREPPSNARSVQDLARGIEDRLIEQGVSQVHLAGHSLGGAVSLALCEAGRLSVLSLTLLAPAGLGAEIDGAFIEGFARASRPESLAPWLKRLVTDETLISPAFVNATAFGRAATNLAAQQQLASTLFPDGTQACSLRNALRLYKGPQRIIWGLQDRIIPWKHAIGVSGRAALHLLPNVGHLPQLEAPELVASLLNETLAGV